jgi:site-specific DNA recombinase
MTPQATSLRCAIYTRKSSEEGLEQAFNSLHAQREACEAYARSQAGEGWKVKRDRYDDGGFSGASIKRPALRRLMGDVAAGKVDVVVVYKVDRLTRSLADFARMIEAFDQAGASFVSVTQAFNTTSSMGRLTLNVLLSFAQFEREVTGERIRDKIAASKAKGMWMGGVPPLGYDPPTDHTSRALVLNVDEARTVRLIFHRYLELETLTALHHALRDEGVRSKRRIKRDGRRAGGFVLTGGALRYLLGNRVYLGEIVHRGARHPGRHPPIIDSSTFDAVQTLMAHKSWKRRTHVPKARASLLYGRLFDADGPSMQPEETGRRGPDRYQYYASRRLPGSNDEDAIRRVPAQAADNFVTQHLGRLLGLSGEKLGPEIIRAALARVEVHASSVQLVLTIGVLPEGRGRVAIDQVRQSLLPGEELRSDAADARRVRISIPTRLKLWGGRSWIRDPSDQPVAAPATPDVALIRRLRAAHAVLRACSADPHALAVQLHCAKAPLNAHQSRLARWAFLAPDIQRAILEGQCSSALLSNPRLAIPLSWSAQRKLLGWSPE